MPLNLRMARSHVTMRFRLCAVAMRRSTFVRSMTLGTLDPLTTIKIDFPSQTTSLPGPATSVVAEISRMFDYSFQSTSHISLALRHPSILPSDHQAEQALQPQSTSVT